jgi:hypothetical protein
MFQAILNEEPWIRKGKGRDVALDWVVCRLSFFSRLFHMSGNTGEGKVNFMINYYLLFTKARLWRIWVIPRERDYGEKTSDMKKIDIQFRRSNKTISKGKTDYLKLFYLLYEKPESRFSWGINREAKQYKTI